MYGCRRLQSRLVRHSGNARSPRWRMSPPALGGRHSAPPGQVPHRNNASNYTLHCEFRGAAPMSEVVPCQSCAGATTLTTELLPLGADAGHRVYFCASCRRYTWRSWRTLSNNSSNSPSRRATTRSRPLQLAASFAIATAREGHAPAGAGAARVRRIIVRRQGNVIVYASARSPHPYNVDAGCSASIRNLEPSVQSPLHRLTGRPDYVMPKLIGTAVGWPVGWTTWRDHSIRRMNVNTSSFDLAQAQPVR